MNVSMLARLVLLALWATPVCAGDLIQVDFLTAYDPVSGALVERQRWPERRLVAPSEHRRVLDANAGLVACSTSDDAYPFDLASHELGGVIAILPEGNYPYDATISPDETEVWVVGASGDGVAVIDRATMQVSQRIPVGDYPIGVAFSSDSCLAFVSSRNDESLSVIDAASYSLLSTLSMPADVGNLALDPVSGRVYGVEWYSDLLYEIEADGSALMRSVSIGSNLWQLVVSPDGSRIYATDRGSDEVIVVDRLSFTELRRVPVGDDPWGLDLTRDGGKLVVVCEDSQEVNIIDTASWDVTSVALDADADARDVDIDDATGLAFVAGGTAVGIDPIYVIDIAGGTLLDTFAVTGGNTNVVAVAPQASSGECSCRRQALTRLRAVKAADAVSVSWAASVTERDGYNVWRVADKTDIPDAAAPPGPGVTGVCAATPSPDCSDPGAVPASAGSLFFYQVKGLCDGLESP